MNVTSPVTEQQRDPVMLIDAVTLARHLDISKRTLQRLLAAGRLLEPVRLGGVLRWRHDEVRRWVAAGCPKLEAWKQMGGPRCRD